MPHYKAPDNSLHFIEPEFAHLLPAGCVQITEEDADALRPVFVVIQDVTPRQIRMALSREGLRTSVETAIAAGSQDLKDWYEFSTTFQRTQPLVVQMGIDLGQTPEQLDALWQLAATL